LPEEHVTFRKELRRLREHADTEDLLDLTERILSRLESDREESERRFRRLSESLRALDARVLAIENSRVFRLLQRLARSLRTWKSRGRRYVWPEDQAALTREYGLWLERQALLEPSCERVRDAIRAFTYRPRFSLLMHVDGARRERLSESIAAIVAQSYQDWELCVCDDASAAPWVAEYLQQQAARDSRIQYMRSARRMGAASSLNRAGMLSGGEYVACVGRHDRLTPNALFHFAEALQTNRCDLFYADEDHLDSAGRRERPCFKPGWSPDLLVGSVYPGRFLMIATNAMHRAGWFRVECDGAHAYDLALRVTEAGAAVRHVPRVLYSVAEIDATRERQTLEEAAARRGWSVSIEDDAGLLRVRRKLVGTPLASIIICSRTASLLKRCLRVVDHVTAYPVREIVVVQHKTGDDAAMDQLLARSRCVRVSHAGVFDFAQMNNRGAKAASGDYLVFLNDDVEPLSAGWLGEMLAQAQRAEIGVVGARLLYPSGAVQHAGIALGLMDGTGHPHRGTLGGGFWRWSETARNVSAVTGACMAMRRAVFEELGGFDPRFPVNYNDVDLCLRARRRGYEVICEASAVLRHYESRTRTQGVSWQERELWFERWGALAEQGDPYYSRSLVRSREDCSLDHG
jgi:GT2 family glycosyltransferase